jgi:hypothetical protein
LWQKQIQLSNIDRSPDETDEHAADDLLDGRSKSEVVRTNENTSPLKVLNLSRNKVFAFID